MSNSHRTLLAAATVAASMFIDLPAQAISLEFVPSGQSTSLGSPVSVGVVVADPDDTLVGAFDFFVDFDSGILAVDSIEFGVGLGGPGDSFQSSVETEPGRVNVAEVSLLADLSLLQDGVSDLELISITFNSIAIGTSGLDLSANILGFTSTFLGDELGFEITLDEVGAGDITVVAAPANEPATMFLLIGSLGIVLAARKARCIGCR